jgi:hypothetical protein
MAVKSTTDVNRIYPVETTRVQEARVIAPTNPTRAIQTRTWQGPERRISKDRRRNRKTPTFFDTRSQSDRRQRQKTSQGVGDTIGPGFLLIV